MNTIAQARQQAEFYAAVLEELQMTHLQTAYAFVAVLLAEGGKLVRQIVADDMSKDEMLLLADLLEGLAPNVALLGDADWGDQ